MTSIKREYAQRNTNVTTVVPVINTSHTTYYNINIDPRYSSVFTVDLTTITPQSGINVSTPNTSTNTGDAPYLNLSNQYVFYFLLNLDSSMAKNYPGLEFTIFFKNARHITNAGESWISFYSKVFPTTECDIFTSRYMLSSYNTLSVTLRSDGDSFTVVSSGPQAWSYGPYDC